MFSKRFLKAMVLAPLMGMFVQSGLAEPISVQITNIQEKVHSNWMKIPQTADYDISWKLIGGRASNANEVTYHLNMQVDNVSSDWDTLYSGHANHFLVEKKPVSHVYRFKVSTTPDSIVESDVAEIRTGYGNLYSSPPGPATNMTRQDSLEAMKSLSNHLFKHLGIIPFNGRWFLWLSQHSEMFDESTFLGKLCFHGIWNAMLVGVFIVIFFCMKYLRSNKISPNPLPLIGFLHDNKFIKKKPLTQHQNDFDKLFDDWKTLITKQRNRILINQNKTKDCKDENFSIIVPEEIEIINGMIKKIDNEYINYPTGRIFRRTLESHLNHQQFDDEVERDFENLASYELEVLSQQSRYEWLLTISQICPLLGLFGTVTGISGAFLQISNQPASYSQKQLVMDLSGGIFEALWTTIEGLLFGMLFLLIYHYCHRHISKINSIWHQYYTQLLG